MMWFQTLKTRQTVKNLTSSNSHGQLVAIEYSDKKVDVHMLKVSELSIILVFKVLNIISCKVL